MSPLSGGRRSAATGDAPKPRLRDHAAAGARAFKPRTALQRDVDLRPVTLRGRHVLLEPLRPEHADELWPAASEREIWRYMGSDGMGVASRDGLAQWIANRIAGAPSRMPALPFLLRDAATGRAFGSS